MEREAMRLRQSWSILFKELGTEVPSITQFYVWLGGYAPVTVERAIHSTLKKAFLMSEHGEMMSFAHRVNYATKAMRMETQQEVERELGPLAPAPTPVPVSQKKVGKILISPFTGKPLRNPVRGEPVREDN